MNQIFLAMGLRFNILLPDGLTPDSLPPSQSLYGKRSVVDWRDNQIFSDG